MKKISINSKRFSQAIAIIFCLALISSTMIAFAASSTLLSYNGTGIRSKNSVNTFTLSSNTTITLNHNQQVTETFGYYASDCKMTVKLQKKGTIFFSDTGDNLVKYGSGSATKTMTKSAGTYRLRFESKQLSSTAWPAFNINGTVKK